MGGSGGHDPAAGQRVPRAAGSDRARFGGGPNGRVEIVGDEYSWYPPPDVGALVPADFRLRFACGFLDGARYFMPVGSVCGFVTPASLGGLALLARDQGLDGEHRSTYHRMRLIWQQAPHVREHLTPRFRSVSDLYAAYADRGDATDILPDALGLDPAGGGSRWRPLELVAAGRAAALAAGEHPTDTARSIRRGLLEAARRAPLDPRAVPPDRALANVRAALFALGPGPAVDEEVIGRVYGRLADLMRKHDGDDPAAFREWVFGDPDNLVHGIAKRKGDGGTIPRTAARRAYLELVWRSYAYAGITLRCVMRAFAAALPDPLVPAERLLFDSLYRGQAYLGGLPLTLLVDRFGFFAEALQEVWARPGDERPVGVLLRMMADFGEMIDKRRAADRHAKRRGQARTAAGKVAREMPLDDTEEPRARDLPEGLQEIADALRESLGRPCPCGRPAAWSAWLPAGPYPPGVIRIEERCDGCGDRRLAEYPRSEVERVAKKWKGVEE